MGPDVKNDDHSFLLLQLETSNFVSRVDIVDIVVKLWTPISPPIRGIRVTILISKMWKRQQNLTFKTGSLLNFWTI